MILAYILSFLGMLSWQWGAHNELGMAGKLVGIVLLVVAVIKTVSALGGKFADKKSLLGYFGGHAAIWIAGMFLYEYILGLLTIVGVLIGIVLFGNFSSGSGGRNTDEERTAGSESNLSLMPVIIYDDSNGQWKRRGIFGDHAVYYNNDGGEVTIYSAQVSGNSASTSAGTFHWY
ncbi:hypothetical protein ABXS75_12375 [Roseburia hominis]